MCGSAAAISFESSDVPSNTCSTSRPETYPPTHGQQYRTSPNTTESSNTIRRNIPGINVVCVVNLSPLSDTSSTRPGTRLASRPKT